MANIQILVVEDEIIVSMEIQDRLESLGYTVTNVVSSGEEAVKEAEEACPDLVLMDIMLEGDMDGIEAARQIHDRMDIPVVYLTAYADMETFERAEITKPYGYIIKPFEVDELYAAIEEALNKHRMEKELEENGL